MRIVAAAPRDIEHRPQAAAQRGLLTSAEPPLFAVADGMGGAQAGEVASALAADAVARDGARPGGERRGARSSS